MSHGRLSRLGFNLLPRFLPSFDPITKTGISYTNPPVVSPHARQEQDAATSVPHQERSEWLQNLSRRDKARFLLFPDGNHNDEWAQRVLFWGENFSPEGIRNMFEREVQRNFPWIVRFASKGIGDAERELTDTVENWVCAAHDHPQIAMLLHRVILQADARPQRATARGIIRRIADLAEQPGTHAFDILRDLAIAGHESAQRHVAPLLYAQKLDIDFTREGWRFMRDIRATLSVAGDHIKNARRTRTHTSCVGDDPALVGACAREAELHRKNLPRLMDVLYAHLKRIYTSTTSISEEDTFLPDMLYKVAYPDEFGVVTLQGVLLILAYCQNNDSLKEDIIAAIGYDAVAHPRSIRLLFDLESNDIPFSHEVLMGIDCTRYRELIIDKPSCDAILGMVRLAMFGNPSAEAVCDELAIPTLNDARFYDAVFQRLKVRGRTDELATLIDDILMKVANGGWESAALLRHWSEEIDIMPITPGEEWASMPVSTRVTITLRQVSELKD